MFQKRPNGPISKVARKGVDGRRLRRLIAPGRGTPDCGFWGLDPRAAVITRVGDYRCVLAIRFGPTVAERGHPFPPPISRWRRGLVSLFGRITRFRASPLGRALSAPDEAAVEENLCQPAIRLRTTLRAWAVASGGGCCSPRPNADCRCRRILGPNFIKNRRWVGAGHAEKGRRVAIDGWRSAAWPGCDGGEPDCRPMRLEPVAILAHAPLPPRPPAGSWCAQGWIARLRRRRPRQIEPTTRRSSDVGAASVYLAFSAEPGTIGRLPAAGASPARLPASRRMSGRRPYPLIRVHRRRRNAIGFAWLTDGAGSRRGELGPALAPLSAVPTGEARARRFWLRTSPAPGRKPEGVGPGGSPPRIVNELRGHRSAICRSPR